MSHIGWFLVVVWNIAWIVYSIRHGSVREVKQCLRVADKKGFGDQLRKDIAEFIGNPQTSGGNVPRYVRHRCWDYEHGIKEEQRKERAQQALAQKQKKQQEREALRVALRAEKNLREYGQFIVSRTAEDQRRST